MSEPVPLSSAISELIALRGYARRQADRDLREIWGEVAGPGWAAQSRPVKVARGILQVEVTSAALWSELTAFHTPELTRRLQRAAPHLRVKSIRFRLAGG